MSSPNLQGHARSLQVKPGHPTTTIINADGEVVSWDAVEEACVITPMRNKDELMTAPEAAKHFKIDQQAIYARARRCRWRMVNGTQRRNAQLRAAKIDWLRAGDNHREIAFKVGHESLKKFKPRSPKNFRELEIADRIARRAAGLETGEVINQTLVHINEAIEDHGEQQVIEATEVENQSPEQPQIADIPTDSAAPP